jgi:hypothetical protein
MAGVAAVPGVLAVFCMLGVVCVLGMPRVTAMPGAHRVVIVMLVRGVRFASGVLLSIYYFRMLRMCSHGQTSRTQRQS